MIDATTFAKWMRVLAERIGKPLSPDTGAVYYATLSAELDTAQFETAMQRIFRDHQYATWPSPKSIIEGVRPTMALNAAAAWTDIAECLRLRPSDSKPDEIRRWIVGRAGETAAATFDAIGGLHRYSRSNDWQLDQMRTEFLERMPDMERLAPLSGNALPNAITRHIAQIGQGPRLLAAAREELVLEPEPEPPRTQPLTAEEIPDWRSMLREKGLGPPAETIPEPKPAEVTT